MTIKECSCGCKVTTKNVLVLGRRDWGDKIMWFFNCRSCNSTSVLSSFKKIKTAERLVI